MWRMPWLVLLVVCMCVAIRSIEMRAANPLARAASFEFLVSRYVEAL